MTNILLGGNHRAGETDLRFLLKNLFLKVKIDEVSDRKSVLEKVKRKEYHLIILGDDIQNADSTELVETILAAKPQSRILAFSRHCKKVSARNYLQAGAMGFLSLETPEIEIRKALDNILHNKRYVSALLLEAITHDVLNEKINNPFSSLSNREFEIMHYFLKGEKLSAISATLGLHSSTIQTYSEQIFEKTGCKDIPELNHLAKLHNIA